MKLSEIKTDSILVILVLAVVVGGFWMNGKAVNERSDAVMAKLQSMEMSIKRLEESMRRMRPAAPAVEPVPADPAPAEPAPAQ